MASYAEIDRNNIVLRVIVINDDQDRIDGEAVVKKWLAPRYGGTWLRSDNSRKNRAGIGWTYDADRDAFIPPKVYASWVLNETTARWVAPIKRPTDEKTYEWNEDTQDWVEEV